MIIPSFGVERIRLIKKAMVMFTNSSMYQSSLLNKKVWSLRKLRIYVGNVKRRDQKVLSFPIMFHPFNTSAWIWNVHNRSFPLTFILFKNTLVLTCRNLIFRISVPEMHRTSCSYTLLLIPLVSALSLSLILPFCCCNLSFCISLFLTHDILALWAQHEWVLLRLLMVGKLTSSLKDLRDE